MIRRRAAAAFIPLAVMALSGQAQFRASTSLVRLELQVVDSRGHVGGLQASDFVVEDRGDRQTVRVEEFIDGPLDVVVVAPPVSAVSFRAADNVVRFTTALVASLRQVQDRDRLGVVLAGATPSQLRPLESGPPAFGIGAFESREDSYSASYDAIALGLRLFKTSNRRQVMLAFESVGDVRSILSGDTVAELAGRLGPAFVLVASPVSVRRTVSGRAEIGVSGRLIGDPVTAAISADVVPATLERLVNRSHGTLVNLGEGEPAELITRVLTSLRSGYVVTYELPRAPGWHPVKIRVPGRTVKVAVREGYTVQ